MDVQEVQTESQKYIVPDVDTYENDNEYILKVDMPGVGKDGLEIVVEENTLEIKGQVEQAEDDVVYREFNPYNYKRSFKIGRNIDQEKVHASVEQGILTLTLPKAEAVKPRRIEIE